MLYRKTLKYSIGGANKGEIVAGVRRYNKKWFLKYVDFSPSIFDNSFCRKDLTKDQVREIILNLLQ